MNWTGKPHPLELAAEWGAPLVLAAAAGWAASIAGLPPATMAVAGAAALGAGIIAMRMAGSAPVDSNLQFEPVPFGDADNSDELLLDNPLVELLLDDPLVEVEPDSRVVKLFARQDPTPGELVLRISDYLNDPTKTASVADSLRTDQPLPDASAALHSALANIRASLR